MLHSSSDLNQPETEKGEHEICLVKVIWKANCYKFITTTPPPYPPKNRKITV